MEYEYLINSTIEITLDKIVFSRDDFVIARVFSRSKEIKDLLHPIYGNISIKGNMTKLKNKIEYNATISGVEKNKYGVTLNVTSVHPKDFNVDSINTDEDMVTFIEVFVGEGTALRIANTKGVCDMIKNEDIDSLIKIKGIGNKTAYRLINVYKDEVVGSEYIIKLKKLGFTDNEINKLKTLYKKDLPFAYEVIDNNIFSLIFKGFQLGRMDNIFLENMKGDKKDDRRIKAYLWKALKDAMYFRYKSYISLKEFYNIDIVQNIEANVGRATIDKGIKKLVEDRKVKIIDEEYITSYEEYSIEKNLMDLLDELSNMNPYTLDVDDLDGDIEEQEEIMGFKLNEGQRRAVKDIILSNKTLNMLNGFARHWEDYSNKGYIKYIC